MKRRQLLVLFALVALVVGACSTTGPESETDTGRGGVVEATHWVLRSLDVDGTLTIVPDTLYADAKFNALRVQGFSGCNDYSAVAITNGRYIRVSQQSASTLMSCGEEADQFEAAYRQLLGESRYFTVWNHTLRIYGPDLRALLLFDAAPRNPLLGVWNVDSYQDAANSQAAPIEDSTLTATFGLLRASGSGGCNTYDGTYSTNGSLYAVSRLATTLIACPDDVMAQEAAFLQALEGIGRIELRAQTVNLFGFGGDLRVSLTRPDSEDEPAVESTPTVAPTEEATEEPTEEPTEEATEEPTEEPTEGPTEEPTAQPTAEPTLDPPPVPTTTECSPELPEPLTATIVYPESWAVVTDPPCQYFSREPVDNPNNAAISVTFNTEVTHDDVVAAFTDEAGWANVSTVPATISGLPATAVVATSIAGDGLVPNGQTAISYVVDLGASGVALFQTFGEAGDELSANALVMTLMATLSTISTTIE